MAQIRGVNSSSSQHGSGSVMVLDQDQHHHHDSYTQEDLYSEHDIHVNTLSSSHDQDAYPLDGSHSWSPYFLPVLNSGPSTGSEYGLYYTVAPATLGFPNDGDNYTAAGTTENQAPMPGQYDTFPRSAAGMELYGQGTMVQQQFTEDSAMHHGQQISHRPSFCGYQDPPQAPVVSPSGWPSDQGHSDHTLVEPHTPRELTQQMDHHETPTTTKGRKRKSTTMTRAKQGKAEHKENDDPQAPAPKRRGRKPNAKTVKPDSPEVAPLTIWPPKHEQTNQHVLFTASPNSYASQSSQTPTSSMTFATGSTAASFDSNSAAHEAYAEVHHNNQDGLLGHSNNGLHSINTFTPHTFSLASSISSSSPRPPPTPVTPSFPTFPSATYPQQHHQPPYHQHHQQQQQQQRQLHRASFSGIPHYAAHHLQSQLLPATSRRQSTSSVDMTQFADPMMTLLLPKDQRARNRVAANKCRLKTKAAVTRLEEEERAASERHAELSRAAQALKDEVYLLRNQLLMHTDCDCTMIHKYLANTARDLANGMTSGGGSSSSVRPKNVRNRSSYSSMRSRRSGGGGGRDSNNEDERGGDGGWGEEDGSGETDEDDEEGNDNNDVEEASVVVKKSPVATPHGVALDTFSNPATKVAAMEQIGKRAEKQRLQYLSRAMAMAGMVPVQN